MRFLSQYVEQLRFRPWLSKPRPAATFVDYVFVYTSHYMFGHAFGAPKVSIQSAHEGGRVVSPTHFPGDVPGTHLC